MIYFHSGETFGIDEERSGISVGGSQGHAPKKRLFMGGRISAVG